MKYEKQIIYGKLPSKSNCYKIITFSGHSSLAKQKVLKDYEKVFYLQCGLRDKNIKGFFKIDVDVYHENMRPDLDNGFKILLDCLQGCKAIKNDRQCVEIHARKLIDKNSPRIEFVIEEVEI
jgi:Holliday junction resolvase RusA-like endonuclease